MFLADIRVGRKAQANFPNDAHKIIISGVFRRGVIYPNAEAYVRFGRGSLFGNLPVVGQTAMNGSCAGV